MEELYVLIKNGRFYTEKTNNFDAFKEDDATKYNSNEVYKKKRKLEKKTYGNISVKVVGK